jgi:hypothetical protein
MSQTPEFKKQQYQRMIVLSDLARQRYLDAGGDPQKCPQGLKNDDYLTEEERREFLTLGRQIFGVKIEKNEVHCQGRSWQLPIQSTQ